MTRKSRLYLKDMLTACEDIQDFVRGMDFQGFMQDKKTRSAVIRQFEILGEASKAVSISIRRESPQIQWKEIARMRDRLIHGYFGVDYRLVWDTINTKIPELERELRVLLKDI